MPSEYERSNLLVEKFLGITFGHLCPQFGINHNTQQLLLLETLTSFLAFHGLLLAARWASVRLLKKGPERNPDEDASLQELERFSTMVDRTLVTMTQAQLDNGAAAGAASAAGAAAPGPSNNTTPPRGGKKERPKDIERLREEFQGRINAVKNKWQAPRHHQIARNLDDVDEFHVAAAVLVVYWAIQALLCCIVISCIGLRLLKIPDGGIWPHYCLLTYAVSNCGLLPTGCLGLAFLADWTFFDGITILPVQDLEGAYRTIEDSQAAPLRTEEDVRRHKADVADLKSKFMLLCLPEFVPLFFMFLTHTLPFLFMFLWLSLLMILGIVLVIAVIRWLMKQFNLVETPQGMILRQTQVLVLLGYMFVSLFIHTSVQVMSRVYAGEWRHGGQFDALWWHLIIDDEELTGCSWFSTIRFTDGLLRWT